MAYQLTQDRSRTACRRVENFRIRRPIVGGAVHQGVSVAELKSSRQQGHSEMIGVTYIVESDRCEGEKLAATIEDQGGEAVVFGSAEEFLGQYSTKQAGCLVVGQHLPGMDGLELQAELQSQNIVLPFIFLTTSPSVEFTVQAMKNDAVTVFEKPCSPSLLLEAIIQAQEDCVKQRRQQRQKADAVDRIARLREDERQVLELMVLGLLNKQMASRLEVSLRTIENRRAKIFEQLEVQTVPDLIRVCILAGFIEP